MLLCCCLGGLLYLREWNNMQYSASAAFAIAVYSEYLSKAKGVVKCPEAQLQPQDLLAFAKSQVCQYMYLIIFFLLVLW